MASFHPSPNLLRRSVVEFVIAADFSAQKQDAGIELLDQGVECGSHCVSHTGVNVEALPLVADADSNERMPHWGDPSVASVPHLRLDPWDQSATRGPRQP